MHRQVHPINVFSGIHDMAFVVKSGRISFRVVERQVNVVRILCEYVLQVLAYGICHLFIDGAQLGFHLIRFHIGEYVDLEIRFQLRLRAWSWRYFAVREVVVNLATSRKSQHGNQKQSYLSKRYHSAKCY